MKLPKILIGAPQNAVKDYCFEAWLDNIKEFSFPLKNIDIFLADNSETPEYAEMLSKKYGIKTVWSAPNERDIRQCMAESHNLVRDYALRKNFDFLLHLETDVFPPYNVIERLLYMHKPISAALYHVGSGAGRRIMMQTMSDNPLPHYRQVITHSAANCYLTDGTVKKVFHAGLGCVLIHKSVLNNFTFRWEKDTDAHPDTFFAKDMYDMGQPIYLHTGIFCYHYNKQTW